MHTHTYTHTRTHTHIRRFVHSACMAEMTVLNVTSHAHTHTYTHSHSQIRAQRMAEMTGGGSMVTLSSLATVDEDQEVLQKLNLIIKGDSVRGSLPVMQCHVAVILDVDEGLKVLQKLNLIMKGDSVRGSLPVMQCHVAVILMLMRTRKSCRSSTSSSRATRYVVLCP